jgi:hypothetical protein
MTDTIPSPVGRQRRRDRLIFGPSCTRLVSDSISEPQFCFPGGARIPAVLTLDLQKFDGAVFSAEMARFLLFVCTGRPLRLGSTASAVASPTIEHSNLGASRNKVRRAGQRIVVRLAKARHERVRRFDRQRVGDG